MAKTADVHLTLPSDLVTTLDEVARDQGVRRVTLVRQLIEDYLKDVKARRIEAAMRDYVETLAPFSGEFVAETEEHTVERLLRETEW
ncbi:MAG TPA: hypothetical protein VGK54_02395 [Chloroflexota bacterium]